MDLDQSRMLNLQIIAALCWAASLVHGLCHAPVSSVRVGRKRVGAPAPGVKSEGGDLSYRNRRNV